MNKFSIIVPIYNIEGYIGTCIESVLSQAYRNFEVLLVNDGSKDTSGNICEEYAKKDERVVYLPKINGGLSDARNYGLSKASGDYVLFLDGDDFLEPGVLKKINAKLVENKNIDFLLFNYNYYVDSKNEKQKEIFNINELALAKPKIERLEILFEGNSHTTLWSAWRDAIKLDFIKEHNLKFDKNIVGAEDCDWFLNCMLLCENFTASDIVGLNYRVDREGSITKELKYSAIIGQLKIFYKWFKHFETSSEYLQKFMADKYLNTLPLINRLKGEELDKASSYISERKEVLNFAMGKKQKMAASIVKVFGVKNGIKLVGKLTDLKNKNR
ncbi:MAG: glycosyltransferase family 2 protein [Sarcina sp.]